MRKKHFSISIVAPVFNEAANIPEFIRLVTAEMTQITSNYEVLFIDDGSTDSTFEVIRQLAVESDSIKAVQFSRNMGQQTALACGLEMANGDLVITIDADLQQPPQFIPSMIQKWQEGFDVVHGVGKDRYQKEPIQLIFSRLFYWVFSRLSGMKLKPGSSDFRLMDRQVVDELNRMGEHFKFFRGLARYVGFKQIDLVYETQRRFTGTSSYDLRKLFYLAANGLFSFVTPDFKIVFLLGTVLMIGAFFYLLIWFAAGGWQSGLQPLLWSAHFFLMGFLFWMIGTLAFFIARINIEVKKRPLYFIKHKIGFLQNSKNSGQESNRGRY